MKIPKVIHVPLVHFNMLALKQKGILKDPYISRTFTFTEDSIYDVGEDQEDWNKLFGITSSPLDSQKASHMWAWRYVNNSIQLAPYSHKPDGERILPPKESILTVPFDIPITLKIFLQSRVGNEYSTVFEYIYSINKQFYRDFTETPCYLKIQKSYRIITSWFGGNRTPNKIVKIY